MVLAAAKGDDRAWRKLVHQYKRLVYSIPRSYRLSDETCDDVFQTIFATLVRELPAIKDPKSLTKWLMTSTHRECWKASKRERSRQASSLDQHQPQDLAAEMPSDRADLWERRQMLDSALSSLGGRCEKLLRLLYLSPVQIPYEQVGETLGIALGSVGPTRARCLAKLADSMNPVYGPDVSGP